MFSASHRSFFVPMALLSLALPLFAHEPTVLIETDFANQAPGEAVVGTRDQELPLKFPSEARAEAGSSLIVSKEAMGNLNPPFAFYQLGGGTDKTPSSVANASMEWDLRREGMTEGVFELTATITPLDAAISGGRLIVRFLDGEGKAVTSDPPFHPMLLPAMICFQGTKFLAGGKLLPFQAEQTYEIKMMVNITKREWSCWVDGDEVVSAMPFPPEMSTNAYPSLLLSGVSLGSWGGFADKPDARYALSKLTFKKLAE